MTGLANNRLASSDSVSLVDVAAHLESSAGGDTRDGRADGLGGKGHRLRRRRR